jgi:hypothetical protein
MRAYQLANLAGIGQPTLSKFMNGRTKTLTHDIRAVINYAELKLDSGISDNPQIGNVPAIQDAIASVWDGSMEHATALAELIEAVGPVLSRYLRSTAKRSTL